MENVQLLHSLEAVAGELAVQIRHEDLEGNRGGLCRLRGRVCILVDRNLSVSERVNLMARCLAQLPGLVIACNQKVLNFGKDGQVAYMTVFVTS